MLLTMQDERFLGKYFEPLGTEYVLKDNVDVDDIPQKDIEKIKEYDESYMLLYGKHMIIDFDTLFK